MIEIKISENEANQRVDKFLRKYLSDASLSYVYKLVRKKNIKLNGKRAKVDTILKEGDVLTLYISEENIRILKGKKTIKNIKKDFKIAYEDENIIIVEKPKGLLVHGTKDEKKNTLVNQVVAYLNQKGDYNPETEKTFIPAAVNRLDRNTSGLVIFGKNNRSLQVLNAMIREKNNIRKFYIAMVEGGLKKPIYVKGNIIKNQKKNKVSLVSQTNKNTKEIETIFRPLRGNGIYTIVEAEIITGRTHQIRAHLSDLGFPILGDEKYGNRKLNDKMRRTFDLKSQYLHAYKIFFQKCYQPLDYLEGKEIFSDIPMQFKKIEERLLTNRRE